MGDWEWLAQVDPVSVERERFNVTARAVRRREGTHLGLLAEAAAPDVRIIRALSRERELETREQAETVTKGQLHSRIRNLETALARERRKHASELAWQKKLTTWGHRNGGPSALEGTA